MEKPWGKLEDMGAVGGDMVIDADNLIKYSSAQAFSQVHENTFSSCSLSCEHMNLINGDLREIWLIISPLSISPISFSLFLSFLHLWTVCYKII